MRIFAFILIFIFLILPARICKADEKKFFVDFSLISKHFDTDDDYNEINPGLGFSYFLKDFLEPRIGYFNNSYKRPTFYFTANCIPLKARLKRIDFNFAIATGFATGYKDGEIKVFKKNLVISDSIVPVIAPNIEIMFKPVNTRLILVLLGNALCFQVSYAVI